MDMRWQQKRVFVTGGSSGIGKAIALQLVREGAQVVLCGRDPIKLERCMIELSQQSARGGSVRGLTLDVSDERAVASAAPEVLAMLGGLDVLINNAGITHPAAAHDTSLAQYREIMNVNYFGAVHVTKAFLPHFLAQRSGQIGVVLSVAGFMGVYGYSAYAASKHALNGFFDCLRQEMLEHDVAISLLFPGDTNTPQLDAENLIKPEATRAVAGKVPVLEPEYVARQFLNGLARRQYHIVPGGHAKLAYYAQRHAPKLVRHLIDRDLDKVARRTRA